jgi:hypothetical protein
MVVTGEGTRIPYTDKLKFFLDDVVAVIQVKKNLYANDLKSGYANLTSVTGFNAMKGRPVTLLEDAFQSTTRRPLPDHDDVDSLPWEIQQIYHTLVMELVYPARIILGYDGFKSQSSLRKSFKSFLEGKMDAGPAKGFGIFSFPSLVCCGRHCLVKANGMPFHSPMQEDGFWPVFVSTTANPVEMLLQVIWTRLVYGKKIPASVFDDDDLLQPVSRFIDARPAKSGEIAGWAYRVTDLSEDVLDKTSHPPNKWQPVFVDETQFVVVNDLCKKGEVDTEEEDFKNFLANSGYTVEKLVSSLNSVGIAGLKGSILVLLTRGCQCAILPDGRYAVAENISGQLTRWIMEYMAEQNVRPSSSNIPDSELERI